MDRGARGPTVDSGGGGWRRAGEANGAQPGVSNGSGTPAARVDGYNERQRSNDGRGWRSFGSPSTQSAPAAGETRGASQPAAATERVNRGNDGTRTRPDYGNSAAAPAAGPNGDSRGGWRGFGDPGAAGASPRSDDSVRRPRRDTPRENVRPIENRPANQPQTERRSEPAPRVERREQPRPERQQDTQRRENFSQRNVSGSPEPLRISPPIVRERSAPRSERQAERQAPAPRSEKQNESPRGDNSNRGDRGRNR